MTPTILPGRCWRCERAGGAGFQEPVGPLPEQIRLLTYTALGSGCKGLGSWSDRFLVMWAVVGAETEA